LAKIKVRQHVNPLGIQYQQQVMWPNWSQIYQKPEQPLHIDIGSAWGNFALKMAEQHPDWNFLGIEIRQSLVTKANSNKDELGLTNLHYAFANINVCLSGLIASLPAAVCRRVSIQYPDPCFKLRHAKRRVVQPQLVRALAEFLPSGAEIFLQSDLEWVAQEMVDRFQVSPLLAVNTQDWLPENPLGLPTEREVSTLKKGLPVYRRIFTKL
jgi:tRNA (guanine-N7-)-methyltransferase